MSNPWHPWNEVSGSPDGKYRLVSFEVDGRGAVLTTGFKGYSDVVPYDGKILSWHLLGYQVGSIVIDVWRDTYANFPPTVADTIAGGEKPTLVAQNKNEDLSLSTWDRDVKKGDIFGFNIDSVATIERFKLGIKVRPA